MIAVVELETAREPSDLKGSKSPPVFRMLEQAEEFRNLVISGIVADRAELARRHGLTRARVTQLMNLLKLHPVVLAYVRGLPLGTPPRLITERKLRKLTLLPQERQIQVALHILPGFADLLAEEMSGSPE